MESEQTPALPADTKKRAMGKLAKTCVVLFGILLPLFTLVYEMITNACATTFFDPIPTYLHVVLVALVPVSNLAILARPIKSRVSYPSLYGVINGLAIGLSAFYALLFVPLMPLSVFAIMFMGLGLLPLSPLLSFGAGLLCRRALKRQAGVPARHLWWGVTIALSLFILLEIPTALTRIGMKMAASASQSTQLRGLRMLRSVGDQDTMLRMCYHRPGLATDIVGFFLNLDDPVLPSKARNIFYRVNGVPFNSLVAPKLKRSELSPFGRIQFDAEQGGDAVAGRVSGLSLKYSRMDGSVDPDAALSYLEWTLIFKNDSTRQQEARAVVALPPAGVVSRLNLWINGEAREAAFATRGRVTEAYRNVVRRNRDPVLITTNGPDQVMVQCFPVPPGGEMKLRFGMTAPFDLKYRNEAYVQLPHFVEHNFDIPREIPHHVWLESSRAMRTENQGMIVETTGQNAYAIRGAISDRELVENKALVKIAPFQMVQGSWAEDPLSEGKALVRQRIVEKEPFKPAHVVFVIDGSQSMQPHIQAILDTLERFPADMTAGVLVAGDQVEEIAKHAAPHSAQDLHHIRRRLSKHAFRGGCDNIKALESAWELVTPDRKSAVVWIHGVQPVALSPVESLVQKWERRAASPIVYDLQFDNGPNLIFEHIGHFESIQKISAIDTPARALADLFESWRGSRKQVHFERTRQALHPHRAYDQNLKTSDHLVRLWAFERIKALAYSDQASDLAAAKELAVAYQLVTPVSGAVVLENQGQFEAAGLTPAAPDTVPTIPEPEVWMLLIIACAVATWLLWQKRYAWPA